MEQGSEFSHGAEAGDENPAQHIPMCASIQLCDCMAQGAITSTESLINALNEAKTGASRKVLQEWVGAYIGWFDEQRSKGSIKRDTPLQEYSLLAGIQPVHDEQKDLLIDYFNGLCNTIHKEYTYGEEPLIEALEYSLQIMDVGVFEGNPAPLEKLGKTLLAKLDHTETNFTKAAYPSYRSTLHALHLTLMLIRRIDPNKWNATREDGLYSKFRVQVQGIAKKSDYYLIRYHAHLIEQSLRRLASDGEAAWFRDECRRACEGLKGLHCFWKGAKSIATLEFDFSTIVSGFESFQAARRSQHIKKKSWYDLHQSLHHACLQSLTDCTAYKVFQEHLEDVHHMEGFKRSSENFKALRIGVIKQLGLMVLEGCDACVRKASMEELSSLAESCKSSCWLHWLEDKDVLEELLDCLATIAAHSQGNEKEASEVALEILIHQSQWDSQNNRLSILLGGHRRQAQLQRCMKAWLGDQTLKEKLRTMICSRSYTAQDSLFSAINWKIRLSAPTNHLDSEPAEKVHQALREHYQNPTFTMMPSLFRGQAPKHVDSLQCQLMLIEQVERVPDIESEDTTEVAEQAGKALENGLEDTLEDNLCTHHKRLEWVKTPIALKDLMNSRSIKPGEPEHDIQMALLVGNPGTGKTALSRKLAYSWAKGEWGQEFRAVYVLPVRALQRSDYDSVSMRRDQTLATAVANNCFPLQNKDEMYKRLRNQISEDLQHPTTLVVLDGLDERCGASEVLLDQAKNGKHKLLMLSRPYGIEAERTLADVEIEHVGLNDEQMKAFIFDQLNQEGGQEASSAKELLGFIHRQPAILAIAHVPVNLQILCTTWQDGGGRVCLENKQGSLPRLYRQLALCAWDRYKNEKAQSLQDQDREALFTALGNIALRGLQEGRLFFCQRMVEVALNEEAGCVRDMVDDSGFLLLQDLGKEYQFPHLTFQEYFAGRLLAKQFLCGRAQDKDMANKFVSNHKYDACYRVTLMFMAGEVVGMKGSDGFNQLLMLVGAFPREVVGVQHALLQAQLLHEWLCVGGNDAKKELSELEVTHHILQDLQMWLERSLVCTSWGDTKLLSVLTTGLLHLQATVVHGTDLWVRLIDFSKDSKLKVSWDVMECLCKMVEVMPRQALAVQHALLAACRGSNRAFREAASHGVCKIVKLAPDQNPALQEALQLACKDKSWEVRRVAIRGLCKMVEVASGQAPALQEALLTACQDSDCEVGRVAIEALCKMIKVAPDQASVWQEPLLAAGKHSDWEVRMAAIKGLCKIAEVAPGQAPALQEVLLCACKDSNRIVRGIASEGVCKMVELAPEQAPALQKVLQAACMESDWEVGRAAIRGLCKMVEVVPAQALALQNTFLAAIKHSDWEVRCAAISGICKAGKVAPGQAPALQEALLAACKDSNQTVCEAACEGARRMVELAPEQAPNLRNILLCACEDADWRVHQAAIGGLCKMMEVAPGHIPGFQEALLAACKDSDVRVRRDAIQGVCNLVEVVPEQALVFRKALLAACKDSDFIVCQAANRGVHKMAEVAQGHAPALQKAQQAVCKDSRQEGLVDLGMGIHRWVDFKFEQARVAQDYVIIDAHSCDPHTGYNAFPVQQLIDDYWSSKNESLISHIVVRLYCTPLVVQSALGEHCCLVLYPSASKPVIWRKPKKMVEQFVEKMQKKLKGGDCGLMLSSSDPRVKQFIRLVRKKLTHSFSLTGHLDSNQMMLQGRGHFES